MHVGLSDRERKRRVIRRVGEAFIEKYPALAKEIAEALRETRAAERCPRTGKLRSEIEGEGDSGYISARVPSELFFAVRFFIPTFGNDSEDIPLLAQEFPELCQSRKAPR